MNAIRGGMLLLAATLVLGGAASAQDKKPPEKVPETPAKPAAKDDKLWQERHKGFVERAKKGGIDVLFLGDSLTQGWEVNGKEAWKDRFEPSKAVAFGMGGDKTQHLLWRVSDGKDLQGMQPKVVVAQIGGNNLGADRKGELLPAGNSAAEIAAGTGAIVQSITRQLPDAKVILLGILPRSADSAAPVRGRIIEVNKLLAKLDDAKTVRFADLGSALLDKEGRLPEDLAPDGLHLSAKGYQALADALAPLVETALKNARN